MLNLTELTRGEDVSLRRRFSRLFESEVYIAENVGDYLAERGLLTPPIRPNLFLGSDHALIVFHNLGITGIVQDDALLRDMVYVHDDTGSKVMSWPSPRNWVYPSNMSYPQMLDEGGLTQDDWVYELIIRHPYDSFGDCCFVVDVTKQKFTRKAEKKPSLVERVRSLLPESEPLPAPAY